MSELKAVLFDVDGTLAETERHGHLVAFNEAFKAVGLDWRWSAELYGELLAVTGSTERTYHYVNTYGAEYRDINPDLDALIAEMIAYKNDAYVRIVDAGLIPLRPGVARTLREIHDSDVRMAIVTTTGHQNVKSLLESNMGDGVMDWFDVVAAGNIVAHKKPAPDIYDLALEQLGLPAEQCLAIEDSENGVRSAVAASVPVTVVLSEYSQGHNLDGARLIVDQWGNPGEPFSVIEGSAGDHDHVNLALLREIIA